MRGLYEELVLSRLTAWACGQEVFDEQRARVVPRAAGEVVEIGVGAGYNLPHYDRDRVTSVSAIEPSRRLLDRASAIAGGASVPVELREARAEELPWPDARFDTALLTFTLCSVAEVAQGLAEMRRVLRPGGRVVFAEHGRSPLPGVQRWQDRLTPVWKRVAGGCHLNRNVPRLLRAAGFEVTELAEDELSGPRVLGHLYLGEALAPGSAA